MTRHLRPSSVTGYNGHALSSLLGVGPFLAQRIRQLFIDWTLGLRAIRRYGFCHPAARAVRERIAFHTGIPLILEDRPAETFSNPAHSPQCPNCQKPMQPVAQLLARWKIKQSADAFQVLAGSAGKAPARGGQAVAQLKCGPVFARPSRPPPQNTHHPEESQP